MEEEMTETVESAQRAEIEAMYAAFTRRDVEAVLDRLADDVIWANGMEGGHVVGRTAVRDYWTRQFTSLRPSVVPKAIRRGADGTVVVDVHQVVRSIDDDIGDD